MMLRLLRWSERSRLRRLALIAGLVVVSGGIGLLLGRVGGTVAVAVGALLVCGYVVWAIVTYPRPPAARPWWLDVRQPTPAEALQPIPCGLCGYQCAGGFWSPMPGWPDVAMHTVSCGPNQIGERRLQTPTHYERGDGSFGLITVP